MASTTEKKIIKQLEYYFGDINLPRDKFLQEKIKEDEGWIALDVLLTFKRLANLSTDHEVIASAIEKSEKKLVEVSEDRKKLRRNTDNPVPEYNENFKKEVMARTAYAKGFPVDEELDTIIEFLKPHGPVLSCNQRMYAEKITNEKKFKGSCFIIFEDAETCKKFIETEGGIKYKEKDLILMAQEAYIEEKRKEFEERKNKKKNNQAKAEAEVAHADKNKKKHDKCDVPNGAVVHFSGIKPENTLSREEIKEKIEEVSKIELVFIDYSKGLSEGYLRFSGENSGNEFYKELTDSKLSIGDIELSFKLLEENEEEEYRKRYVEAKKQIAGRRKQQFGGKFNNRKRKGFGGDRDGPRSKK